jgi:autotransporter-associated beta strand protein
LGLAGAGTVVNPGGFLDIVNVTTSEPITLNGRGQPNLANTAVNNFGLNYTGALQGSGGFLGVASGPITLGSNSAVGAPAGNLLTISGVIADNGSAFSLTKTQGNNAALIGTGATTGGPGIVKLTAANTYTGATIVEAGDLWLAGAGQTLASTSVVIGTGVSDAALTAVGTSNQFAPNTILTFNGGSKNAKLQLNGTTQTIAGFNVSGSLAIIQNHENGAAGPGTLVVNNPADTSFNGLIRDQNSTLALTKQGVGTLTLSGNGAFGTAGATYTGLTSISAGKLVVSDETAFNSPVTLSGTGSLEFNYSYGRAVAYSKAINDGGLGFTKSGAGDLTLTGASTITGTIQLTGGSLVVGGATGASTIIPNAAVNVAAGAQLNLFGAGGATSYNNNVTLNGLTFGGALAGAVSGGTIDNTLSGNIILNSTSNVSTGWADKTFRMTGTITGAGGLQFDKLLYTQQPPVFQVTNAGNTYSGGTTINAGTVYFASAALPSTGLLTFGGTFTQSSLNTLNGPNLVIGTNGLTGPFVRSVGTGAGQVAFTGEGGGFSAIGGTQTITFGGATPQTVDWGGTGFSSGAALWFNGSNSLAGASAFNADSEVNVTNDIVLSGGGLRRVFVVDNNGSAGDQVRFSGVISGPGGLLKDGGNSAGGGNIQGKLLLGGTAANTFTGLTNLSAGILALTKPTGVNAIGGDLQIGGVQNNGTRRIVYLGANDQIPDTSTVSLIGSNANNGDLRLFGFNESVAAIQDRSGGGVIEVAESGDTGFLGTAISTTATSTLTVGGTNGDSFYNGFLRNNGANNATATGVLNIVKEGTGTLTISQGQQSGSGSQTYSGTTTINGGKLVFSNIGTYNSPVTVNATGAGTGVEFNANINQSFTEGQVISGAGNLTKSGAGTIALSGANAYGGSTTVNGGTLQITGTTAAGQTGAYTVNSGGTLLVGNGGGGGVLTNNNNITVNAGGNVAFSRNNAYTYSGVISGSGNVEGRTGGGLITLSGANTYTGTTTVNGGTVFLGGTGASAAGLIANLGGTLALDFSQPGSGLTNVAAATAPVTLRGGTLNVVGKAATSNAQTLGAVALDGRCKFHRSH